MNSDPACQIAMDPEWVPHAFEPDGGQLTCVFVPRSSRKDLVFLTDGQFQGRYRKISLPVASIVSHSAAAPEAPLHFIFHTSFCCSTLLAKALAVEGVAASLSEPNILVNLAESVIASGLAKNQQSLELALRLLARPLGPAESVIIKPSSFANMLVEAMMTVRLRSRCLLLYSDLRTFLASVVKRGLLGRMNARKLYQNLVAWTSLDFGFSPTETFGQTDLQIAALSWLMQIAHFDELAARLGPERVIVLDAADLLQKPGVELERVQSFFGLGLDARQLTAVLNGPAFAKHSKFSDVDYDSETRERDHDELMKVHGQELEMVIQWLEAVAAHVGAPLRPRSPA